MVEGMGDRRRQLAWPSDEGTPSSFNEDRRLDLLLRQGRESIVVANTN
jgi:hypothetical protein